MSNQLPEGTTKPSDASLAEMENNVDDHNQKAKIAFQRFLAHREKIRNDFSGSVRRLADFASEQTARPIDALLAAEQQIVPTVERYSTLLNDAFLQATGLNLRYDELSSRIQEFYSTRSHFEKMRDLAYLTWSSTGHNATVLVDFWLRSERDPEGISTDAISSPGDNKSVPSDEDLELPPVSFSPAKYVERITELAFHMWEYSDRQFGTTLLDFWTPAENHVSAIMLGAFRKTDSAVDAAQHVAQALADFSPRDHMQEIQQVAYELWLKAGQPLGQHLDYWLPAEQQVLARLRDRRFDDQTSQDR